MYASRCGRSTLLVGLRQRVGRDTGEDARPVRTDHDPADRRRKQCRRSDDVDVLAGVNGDPTDNAIRNTIPLCRGCHHKATFPGI